MMPRLPCAAVATDRTGREWVFQPIWLTAAFTVEACKSGCHEAEHAHVAAAAGRQHRFMNAQKRSLARMSLLSSICSAVSRSSLTNSSWYSERRSVCRPTLSMRSHPVPLLSACSSGADR